VNPPPRFLAVEDVLTLHLIAIEDQGGDSSLRDRSLLDAAVAMPRQQFGGDFLHPNIPAMAAAYAFHICKNHPFVDGNKRAATAAMIAFLSDNGWAFEATADEAEPVILQLAAGAIDKPAFTDWASTHMREKPRMELREFFARLRPEDLLLADRGFDISVPNERDTTLAETSAAIPVTSFALALRKAASDEGRNDHALVFHGYMQLLMTLYRAAEDMGYEW
jgi:death-on-curing protein